MFKIGDEVVIRDGSYTQYFVNGCFQGRVPMSEHNEPYTVLSDSASMAVQASYLDPDDEFRYNTTIIQRGAKVVFINRAFIKLFTCPTCGRNY